MTKLSVIVPVYKAEKYLRRCVDSILAQTFQDYEIILVDDGSPDNCGVICDEYASADSRIKVMHKKNGGVSSARNAGIDVASGEYLAFVDSDDYIAPAMYEKLIDAADSADKDIAICNFMMHFSDSEYPQNTLAVRDDIKINIANLIMSDVGSGSVNMVINRNVLGDLRYPVGIRNGEDYWFLLRLFSKTARIVKIDEPLYYYNRENEESLTHMLNASTDADSADRIQENVDFLKQEGLFDSVSKEMYWSILRFKSTFALTPERFDSYRVLIPESDKYIFSCPMLSSKMKMQMWLVAHHCDIPARLLCRLYNLKK